MEIEWKRMTLTDVSSDISYGYTESATTEKIGPRFLRITDIQNGFVDWQTVPYCLISDNNQAKYLLKRGDIVVARTGNSTGENYIFESEEEAVFASYLIRFKIAPEKADPHFVWYSMRSPSWWDFVNNSKTGSAQAGANAKVLGRFPLSLPPLPEQRRIAYILGSLDEKIELNRKMNETLEAMAQALFISWFVDFDPVIDKALAASKEIPEPLQEKAALRHALGNKRKQLPAEIAALFPDEFVESELGWIPKGWNCQPLDSLIDLIGGGTPKTTNAEYWSGSIPWFSVVDAPNITDVFVVDTVKHISHLGLQESSTKMLPLGATIITARGTVGKCAMVGMSMAMNQSCYGLIGKKGISNTFVYYTIRQKVTALQRNGHGSVFNTITRDTFKNIFTPFGNPEITMKFEEYTCSYFNRILSNCFQQRNLISLRDNLLPKLISGELCTPEGEAMVAEVLSV